MRRHILSILFVIISLLLLLLLCAEEDVPIEAEFVDEINNMVSDNIDAPIFFSLFNQRY